MNLLDQKALKEAWLFKSGSSPNIINSPRSFDISRTNHIDIPFPVLNRNSFLQYSHSQKSFVIVFIDQLPYAEFFGILEC